MISKISYEHIFRTKQVVDISDLVVTKIEKSERYFIHKARGSGYQSGDIISEVEFIELLRKSKLPIILSDSYIDLKLT